jgi:hypothetical protein
MPNTPPETSVKVERPSETRTLFVSGIVGSLDPRQGAMQFYSEHQKVEAAKDQPGQLTTVSRVLEIVADLRMAPATFKSVTLWMQKNLEAYEEKYGEIAMEPTTQGKDKVSKNTERRYA